ncbi:hypothetical protein EYC84_006195 [Monilinia fructicola]|uniref:RRM domain-containing protein n=1 Tax=Monilinia fructicola TaxID=38448 RepID=A0A5M9K7I5_MONFR|nr:hypothetical protein EYC84_006195 [Monilinia fructicola]
MEIPTLKQDAIFKKDDEGDVKIEGVEASVAAVAETNGKQEEHDDDYVDIKVTNDKDKLMEGQQQIKSTDESGQDLLNIPKQAPQQQGVKRKEGSDDRPIDQGATTALLISELHWWNTDDDILNGKSKGQAYVEFTSQQAATAAKRKIDAFGEGQQYVKKQTVTYHNPNVNPFRTLPKDAPARATKEGQNNRSSSGPGGYNSERGNHGAGNFGGNFRGRGGGYNSSRGGMNNNMNQGNFNRNFSGAGGAMGGGFNSPMGGGFQGNPMGGPGGMRGGRGGMGNGMMGGMPMGGMPMGGMGGMGMPMNMGNMAQMGGAMQGGNGFQPMQPHFNPAFFQQNQSAGGDWQNPHGAKRPRPE